MSVSAPTVVATAAQRRSVGLHFWCDGTMGIHRREGQVVVVAPNGPRVARHVVTPPSDDLAGRLLAAVVETRQGIDGLPADVDHASGGPLYHVVGSDQLILVYHGERFRNGDPTRFESFLGLAVSEDTGRTFVDLGPVVTVESGCARRESVDVGSGALIVRDGWMRLYFQDRGIHELRRNLSVARASIEEVVACAQDRRSPTFHKYDGRGWEQPGIGGDSAELLDPGRGRAAWFDAIRLEHLGLDAIVFSTVERVADGVALWNHALTSSVDGLVWSDPVRLLASPEPAEMLYVTLDSGEWDQRRTTTGEFDLYRTRATTPFRWDDACVERIRVRVEATTV